MSEAEKETWQRVWQNGHPRGIALPPEPTPPGAPERLIEPKVLAHADEAMQLVADYITHLRTRVQELTNERDEARNVAAERKMLGEAEEQDLMLAMGRAEHAEARVQELEQNLDWWRQEKARDNEVYRKLNLERIDLDAALLTAQREIRQQVIAEVLAIVDHELLRSTDRVYGAASDKAAVHRMCARLCPKLAALAAGPAGEKKEE